MIFITRLIIFNTLLFGASLNASDNFENYEIRFDISFPFASLEGTKKFEKTKSWLSRKLSSSTEHVDQFANILEEKSVWQKYGL